MKRKKFEYSVEWVFGSNATNPEYMQSYLSARGDHGWELCFGLTSGANGNVFLYFKREAK